MDNYSLEDVKNLVENNLLTSDILKSILESATRRIELYKDSDDLAIIKYLGKCESIPKSTKKEIDKYLKEYKSSVKKEEKNHNKIKKDRRNNIIFFMIFVLIIVIICIITL